jgi:hypothetical protein
MQCRKVAATGMLTTIHKMKNLLFLLIIPITALSCQSPKKNDNRTEIKKLQAELNSKNDSLAILTTQLNERKVEESISKKEDIQSQNQLASASILTVSDKPTTYRLYSRPTVKEIRDFEFAEVLSSTDTLATFMADDFRVTAASVCNGPGDPDLDYCNCSNFIYVVTATDGEYSNYQLFKIGPFVEPQFKGWKKDKEKPALIIEHDIKGKKRTDTFRITLSGVKQI